MSVTDIGNAQEMAPQTTENLLDELLMDAVEPDSVEKVADANEAVSEWLSDIGLAEYCDLFVGEGYESTADMETFTENDLRALGITKQMHIKKVLKKAQCGRTDQGQVLEMQMVATNSNLV